MSKEKFSTIFYNKKDSARIKDIISRAMNGGVVIWDKKDEEILNSFLQELIENEQDY